MAKQKTYYFDNNATTSVAPEVFEAMVPYLTDRWGNPSSPYRSGRSLVTPIEEARERLAKLIGSSAGEIIFTGCGTESINTAITSALYTNPKKRHVITTAVEHSATIKSCQALEKRGYQVTYLPVDREGLLAASDVANAIRSDTAIVSIMWANNETGVLFPVKEIAEICKKQGILFHCDAVQTPGKLSVDVEALGVDFLSLSAHKLHGPKGIGLLYVKKDTPFWPLIIGGHQEQGRRGGTENVASIVGFGKAAELAQQVSSGERQELSSLRDLLEQHLLQTVPGTTRNGSALFRLPNTTNLTFSGIEAEALLLMLDRLHICASSGSACTTGSVAPSHVLTAMGLTPPEARATVRFSLDYETTRDEVEYLLSCLPTVIAKLREAGSPRLQSRFKMQQASQTN